MKTKIAGLLMVGCLALSQVGCISSVYNFTQEHNRRVDLRQASRASGRLRTPVSAPTPIHTQVRMNQDGGEVFFGLDPLDFKGFGAAYAADPVGAWKAVAWDTGKALVAGGLTYWGGQESGWWGEKKDDESTSSSPSYSPGTTSATLDNQSKVYQVNVPVNGPVNAPLTVTVGDPVTTFPPAEGTP